MGRHLLCTCLSRTYNHETDAKNITELEWGRSPCNSTQTSPAGIPLLFREALFYPRFSPSFSWFHGGEKCFSPPTDDLEAFSEVTLRPWRQKGDFRSSSQTSAIFPSSFYPSPGPQLLPRSTQPQAQHGMCPAGLVLFPSSLAFSSPSQACPLLLRRHGQPGHYLHS